MFEANAGTAPPTPRRPHFMLITVVRLLSLHLQCVLAAVCAFVVGLFQRLWRRFFAFAECVRTPACNFHSLVDGVAAVDDL